MNIQRLSVLISLLVITIITGCGDTPEPSPIVAEWDGLALTQDEFSHAYLQETTQKPIADSYEQRKKLAIDLLKMKAVAREARLQKLDTLTQVNNRIRQAREQALRKTYLQESIMQRIPEPEPQQLREAYNRSMTELKLQQIYAQTRPEIDSLKNLLDQGITFEELAQKSMQAPNIQAPDTAWNMGWVSWNDMGIVAENTAFSLDIGDISEPVQSLNGYHIFRLQNRRKTIELDNYGFQNKKEGLAFKWRKRRFDEQILPFIDSVLAETPMQVNLEVVRELSPLVSRWYQDVNPSNAYVTLTQRYQNYTFDEVPPQRAVANLNGEPLTVREFLSRLPEIPPSVVHQGFRPTIEFMLKDKLFAGIAGKNGYQDHPDVQAEVSVSTDRALLFAYMRSVLDTLNQERVIRAYYRDHANERYAQNITTVVDVWKFPDSASTWQAIRSYQKGMSWTEISALDTVEYQRYTDTLSQTRDNLSTSFRKIHHLPLRSDQIELIGPYNINGVKAMAEPIKRAYQVFPLEDIRSEVTTGVRFNIQERIIDELIGSKFNVEEVTIHRKPLQEVFKDAFNL